MLGNRLRLCIINISLLIIKIPLESNITAPITVPSTLTHQSQTAAEKIAPSQVEFPIHDGKVQAVLDYNHKQMKSAELINELAKSPSFSALMQLKEIQEHSFRDLIRDHFPRLSLADKLVLSDYLTDEVLFEKLQRLFEAHQELFSRIESIEQQLQQKTRTAAQEVGTAAGKKVTRAALARRLEKNQQQIRKDQIFVRLTPKSQSCIQFMLCNRNFPRMEVKLSCNQHLEYLVNYLTNKWIRGKVGFKIVLFPDNSFLKAMPIGEKEKALKDPLNNYLMFTDVMTCCGVLQNGVLNLCYEIVEVKKHTKQGVDLSSHAEVVSVEASQSNPIQMGKQKQRSKTNGNNGELATPNEKSKSEEKQAPPSIRVSTPSKFGGKEEYMKEASMFNRNSNFYNNEESLFGSLGFNFNFGATPAKRDEHLLSINSINYMDPHFHETRRLFEEKKEKEGLHCRESLFGKEGGLTDVKVEEVNEEASERSMKREERESSEEREGQAKEEAAADIKLNQLKSFLDRIDQKKPVPQLPIACQDQNNNSNKANVKVVSIVKKRTTL